MSFFFISLIFSLASIIANFLRKYSGLSVSIKIFSVFTKLFLCLVRIICKRILAIFLKYNTWYEFNNISFFLISISIFIFWIMFPTPSELILSSCVFILSSCFFILSSCVFILFSCSPTITNNSFINSSWLKDFLNVLPNRVISFSDTCFFFELHSFQRQKKPRAITKRVMKRVDKSRSNILIY